MNGEPRPATPADAETIAALHAQAFAPEERWGVELFATQLAQPAVFGFVLAGSGMVLARVAADEAEILTIAVVPAARRAGLGRILLAAAEAASAAQGARTMFLEVSPGNLAARALYATAGYASVGRRPHYYPDGSDALVLARSLSPAVAIPA